ncbi:MAG: hypothetical protein R3330_04650 [Saprospiraceae bacterium]|nr:hypothetical protein [Saprospiraceae bacterium]
MASGIRKLANLILYSSLWISVCAAAQVQLTYDVTDIFSSVDAYTAFVLCATLVLYSIHRVIGIRRASAFAHLGRFAVIKQHKWHIVFYGCGGALASGYFALHLPVRTLLLLSLPIAISGAYVLPLRRGMRRLRDLPLIKIFLIGASWSLITTTVPLLHQGYDGAYLAVIFAERFLFVVGITVPFDIRDMQVDEQSNLRTLPHALGITRSKWLASGCVAMSLAVIGYLGSSGAYDQDFLLPAVIVYALAVVLIWISRPGMDDYFFSGLIDGLLLLLPFLYWIIAGHPRFF